MTKYFSCVMLSSRARARRAGDTTWRSRSAIGVAHVVELRDATTDRVRELRLGDRARDRFAAVGNHGRDFALVLVATGRHHRRGFAVWRLPQGELRQHEALRDDGDVVERIGLEQNVAVAVAIDDRGV